MALPTEVGGEAKARGCPRCGAPPLGARGLCSDSCCFSSPSRAPRGWAGLVPPTQAIFPCRGLGEAGLGCGAACRGATLLAAWAGRACSGTARGEGRTEEFAIWASLLLSCCHGTAEMLPGRWRRWRWPVFVTPGLPPGGEMSPVWKAGLPRSII